MNSGNIRSAATAGVIALVVALVLGFVFDMGSTGAVITWSIVLGVATAVITAAIIMVIRQSGGRSAGN